jgi:hypothetical protein
MNDVQSGSKDLLDTTDSLEAVGVFKGWKNFFFMIMVICLLLLQAFFWIVDRGAIKQAGQPTEEGAAQAAPLAPEAPQPEQPAMPAVAEPNTAQTAPAAEPNTSQTPPAAEPNIPPVAPLEGSGAGQSMEQGTKDQNETEPNSVSGFSSFDSRIQHAVAWPSGGFLSGITFERLTWWINFVNAILILSATLYCLTLLFGLKVSMHGRLGGINHISRAFFLSLILLMLLLPWQLVFGPVIVGAIYTPAELARWHAKEAEDVFDLVLYYLRFPGYGVLMLILLILAQIRSVRWAKAILRRLDII